MQYGNSLNLLGCDIGSKFVLCARLEQTLIRHAASSSSSSC